MRACARVCVVSEDFVNSIHKQNLLLKTKPAIVNKHCWVINIQTSFRELGCFRFAHTFVSLAVVLVQTWDTVLPTKNHPFSHTQFGAMVAECAPA